MSNAWEGHGQQAKGRPVRRSRTGPVARRPTIYVGRSEPLSSPTTRPFKAETLTPEEPRRDEVLAWIVPTGMSHTNMAARDKGTFPCDRLIKFHRLEEINQAAADIEKGVTLKPVIRMVL